MVSNLVESRAEKLLQDANQHSISIDVFSCANFLKADIKAASLQNDVSGFLVVNEDTTCIGYNNSHSEHRWRFTIAHEIGHLVMHKNTNKLFIEKVHRPMDNVLYRNSNSSTGEYIQEREANAFAAALLMPRAKVREMVNQIGSVQDTEQLIAKLVEEFNVSEQAMRIRLTNLGIIDYEFQ